MRKVWRVSGAQKMTLAGAGALGFGLSGFFLVRSQSFFLKLGGVAACTAAVVLVFFVVWSFLRGAIWNTEKRLFSDSVRGYEPPDENKKLNREGF